MITPHALFNKKCTYVNNLNVTALLIFKNDIINTLL